MRPWLIFCGRGLRFCLKSVGRFLLWSVWLVLATLLGIQVWIACSHELRLPLPALRLVESLLSREGFTARIGSISFEPGGRLLLRDVELRMGSLDEPVLRCALLHTHLDPWGSLAGSPEANRFEISDLQLLFPAALSPSGEPEAYVQGLDALVQRRDHELILHRLTARCGGVSVLAGGSLLLPPHREMTDTPRENLSVRLSELLRKLARHYHRLSKLQDARLLLHFREDLRTLAMVDVSLQAASLDLAAEFGVEATRLSLQTRVPLRSADAFPLKISGSAGTLTHRFASIEELRVQAEGTFTPATLEFSQGPAELSLGSLKTFGLELEGASASVEAGKLPALSARIVTSTGRNLLDAKVRANLVSGEALANFRLEADASLLDVTSKVARHDLSRYTSIDKGTWAEGSVTFKPGWKLGEARAWAEGDNVVIYKVPFDYVTGRVFFDGRQLLADRAFLRVDRSEARGSYWMDIRNLDFRFLLNGHLQPQKIGGWFNEWWGDFWRNFEFPGRIPDADIDICGRWRNISRFQLYVGVEAQGPRVLGVPMEQVQTRIRVTDSAVHVKQFRAVREEGVTEGWFSRYNDPEQDKYRHLDFDIQGRIRVEDYARMLPLDKQRLLEPVHFQNAALVRAYGRLLGPASEEGPGQDLHFFVDSNGEVQVKDYPVDYTSFEGRWKGPDIDVTALQGRLAGGQFNGHAKIDTRPEQAVLRFDAHIKDAQMGELLNRWEQREAKLKGKEAPPPSNAVERLAGITLNTQLEAAGQLEDPLSFIGKGKAQIGGAKLAQVRLLGGLSELLSFTNLRFTSFKADFELNKEKLQFPAVRLSGHNSAIDGHGTYDFNSATLDFNAKVWPFEENKGLLQSTMGLVLSPLSHAFEVKLQGSFTEPTWAFVYSPFRKVEGDEAAEPNHAPPPSSPNGGQR